MGSSLFLMLGLKVKIIEGEVLKSAPKRLISLMCFAKSFMGRASFRSELSVKILYVPSLLIRVYALKIGVYGKVFERKFNNQELLVAEVIRYASNFFSFIKVVIFSIFSLVLRPENFF